MWQFLLEIGALRVRAINVRFQDLAITLRNLRNIGSGFTFCRFISNLEDTGLEDFSIISDIIQDGRFSLWL